jgi:hypothetical protein
MSSINEPFRFMRLLLFLGVLLVPLAGRAQEVTDMKRLRGRDHQNEVIAEQVLTRVGESPQSRIDDTAHPAPDARVSTSVASVSEAAPR